MYGECILRHESAQLSRDRDEILRKEMHEDILMSRIASNMDKLLNHMQRDNKFRKANKKAMYPIPKINPRLSPASSAQEICNMKNGLKDECKGIVQIAFLPEPEEGASGGPRVVMPGEDIPDALEKKGEGPTCLSTPTPTPPPTPTMGRHNTHNIAPQTGLLTEL